MRNKWVDLMICYGAVACAGLAYHRNASASNFNAMRRARMIYQAAVEAIGRDIVAKSRAQEDVALRRSRPRHKQLPRSRT
jgi:hypothetical protein